MNQFIDSSRVLITVGLSIIFWFFTFGLKLLNFWVSMSIAATTLTCLSIYFSGLPIKRNEFTWRNALIGIGSAIVLYLLFFVAHHFAAQFISFSKTEVASIYTIREQGKVSVIALVLFFLTSPCEELYWRGYVQRWAMERFGPALGWGIGAFIYAGVHLFSGNFMLVAAALVAGMFWGYLYWRYNSILVCIVSHALWTVSIFVIWPIR